MNPDVFFHWSHASHLAWTTAAVDNERVVGAFPIVMDMLKLQNVSSSSRNLLFHCKSFLFFSESSPSLSSMTAKLILFLRQHTIHSIVIEWLDLCVQWLLRCQYHTIRRHAESRQNGRNCRSVQWVGLLDSLPLWLEMWTSRLSGTIQKHQNHAGADRWWWILLARQWGKKVDARDHFMILSYLAGRFLEWSSSGDRWFILTVDTFDGVLPIYWIFSHRRLPNAEHSCAGHEISLFFTMRSLYLSIYDVSPSVGSPLSFNWVLFSLETTVTLVEMDEKCQQHSRLHSCHHRLQCWSQTNERDCLLCTYIEWQTVRRSPNTRVYLTLLFRF